MKAADRKVYAAVVDRANGLCETQCGHGAEQVDHFFGRRRGTAVAGCWYLCSFCHREKTDNNPSAAAWLERFIRHCQHHGYATEAALAENRIAVLKQKGMA